MMTGLRNSDVGEAPREDVHLSCYAAYKEWRVGEGEKLGERQIAKGTG